jgi:hypothetical protein
VAREFHASVHRLQAPDPTVAAKRVQLEVDADVAADAAAAEALVRARVEAGRRAFVDDPAADEDVLARRDDILAAAAIAPPIADADVAELRRLAEDLGRAARIRERTEARFAETLQARVAASTGVALHPAAVRDAGAAVADAERALAEADAAVAALGADPADEPPRRTRHEPATGQVEPVDLTDLPKVAVDPVLDVPHDDFDERRLERRRSRTRAAAVFALALGAGLIVVGAFDAPPAVFAAIVGAGVVLALLELWRGRRAVRTVTAQAEEAEEQSDLLASISAAVAATASGRKAAALAAPDDAREAWLSARVAADVDRDEAEEQLRVARNRWHQLAGPSADPHDVESVIRAHDPQLAYTALAAETSPTVRTVAAFHRKAQARWKVLWAALGHEQAPEPEELEAVLDDLLGDHRRATAEARHLAEAEARIVAEEDVKRPIVLAEPSVWLNEGQLRQLLASVPPHGRVIIIERQDANGPATEAGPDDDEASEAS